MPDPLFDLTGKVAIVTGSGRGLGRTMALGLAAAGAAVVTCARTVEQAEDAAKEIQAAGGRAVGRHADTSDRQSVRALVDATVAEFGQLDVLINNAGIDVIEPSEEVTDEHWQQVLSINLTGYFHCAQEAGRRMLAQGSGSIVNISSIAGRVGIAGLTSYSAAKGGVDQLTRVLSLEWARRGVRVNSIAPGYFENIMVGAGTEHDRPEKQEQVRTFTPMGRRGLPAELVGPAVFLASDASSYVTGAVLYVDGGYTAA
ncbi:MAG TPA: glucose 1-dehydrogenase [Jatrophihabitans sp.]|nr:glucose 1-dehydrogenase [Jatrophihabitans sp.]